MLFTNQRKDAPMELEEIKKAITSLSTEDRRRLALFILELEKEHIQAKVAPQLQEDLDGLSKAMQEAVERIKKAVKQKW